MDLFKPLDGKVSVYLGSGQVGMARYLLDTADIGAILQRDGGHSVTEEVTGVLLATTGESHMVPYKHGEAILMERLSRPVRNSV